eukprot:GHVN01083126.1.p1 GENE.GHVN01083126.1~~GHVN01083126.1.p1  ORF type:complete len:113 (+),score=8.60 GHVN01083126.1:146-484(+)
MSVAYPRVYCKGKACIAQQASDGVWTVSSTQKGAVTTVSSSMTAPHKNGGGITCGNPTDRDGDCLCSNEIGGMCYSSKDKGSLRSLLKNFGYPAGRVCEAEIFAAGCARSAE